MALVGLLALGCGAARPVDGRPCASAAACEQIHPAGIAAPASPDFHRGLLQSGGWDFSSCAKGHGAAFAWGVGTSNAALGALLVWAAPRGPRPTAPQPTPPQAEL